MLRELLGFALIGVGALTVLMRILARAGEHRRLAQQPVRSSRRPVAHGRSRRRRR